MNSDDRQLSFLLICVNVCELFYLSLPCVFHSENKDNENFFIVYFQIGNETILLTSAFSLENSSPQMLFVMDAKFSYVKTIT